MFVRSIAAGDIQAALDPGAVKSGVAISKDSDIRDHHCLMVFL